MHALVVEMSHPVAAEAEREAFVHVAEGHFRKVVVGLEDAYYHLRVEAHLEALVAHLQTMYVVCSSEYQDCLQQAFVLQEFHDVLLLYLFYMHMIP